MTTRGRVLAVDDDEAILGLLARVLGAEGFVVDGVTTAAAAIARLRTDVPDVVLLDVGLADADGFEVLSSVRQHLDVPVILVTARGAEPDRVRGLRTGADDYVVKPFSYPELAARIDNVLRRAGRAAPTTREFGPLEIDLAAREVRVGGELVPTTAKEFDLLAFLSASPGRVYTRDELLHEVWASSSEWQDPATVTEHVRRLRLKIEAEPDRPRWIITMRGVGYRFDAS
ncbi:MAG TPA: response regulator transcription factor [Acidimicrobiales bacterium]|nr:response regulator transcription factor [Acidimicrobiales bacterium]